MLINTQLKTSFYFLGLKALYQAVVTRRAPLRAFQIQNSNTRTCYHQVSFPLVQLVVEQ